MTPEDLKTAAEQKLADLAKLRRDGGVLHDYRAPRWDEHYAARWPQFL